jgi:hypothetical protein
MLSLRRSPRSALPILSPPGHDALHPTGNERKNCTSDATTDSLTKNSPEIEPIACAGNRRRQDLKKLTAAHAAKGASDRIVDNAGIVVPERGPGSVPAGNSRDQLKIRPTSMVPASAGASGRVAAAGMEATRQPIEPIVFAPYCT